MTSVLTAAVATRRRICRVVFFTVAALISVGLFLQHIVGLEPCPLCILQRYAFVLLGAAALLAAVLPQLPSRIAHGTAIVLSTVGAGVASWHVWLQYNPSDSAACGPTLGYMLSELPLSRALPRIFKGGGDCAAIDWSFLGLSIAGWSLVWFVILFVALLVAWRRGP